MSDHGHEHVKADSITAFIVIVPNDGSPAYVRTDITEPVDVRIERLATLPDIRRAAHDIVDDMNARTVAEYLSPPKIEPGERVGKAVAKALEQGRRDGLR